MDVKTLIFGRLNEVPNCQIGDTSLVDLFSKAYPNLVPKGGIAAHSSPGADSLMTMLLWIYIQRAPSYQKSISRYSNQFFRKGGKEFKALFENL
jgi:hypothetical protein